MRARCDHCGARGHEAAPGYVNCSRAFQAVRAIMERRLSMREAADLFGVNASGNC